MAGHAVVGYLAAEAGWTELLPPMVRALRHPASLPGWGPQYGLIRVIGRLGHGDRAAAEVIGDVLADRLAHGDVDGRAVAALAAGEIGDPALVPLLHKCLKSSYTPAQHHAALALARLGDRQLAVKVRPWLAIAGDENYRGVAAEALGNLRDRDSLPALQAALDSEPFAWVRQKLEEAIASIRACKGS